MTNLTKKGLKLSTWGQKRQWAHEGLCEARNFIYLATGIFFVGILTGAAYPELFGVVYETVAETLRYRFEDKGLSLIHI